MCSPIELNEPSAGLSIYKVILGLFWATCLLANGAYAQNQYYLPQIANGSNGGGGFKTTFVLCNNSTAEATVTLDLSNDNGNPLVMTINGNSNSRFISQLPARGTSLLETDGGGSLVSGAARAAS